MARQPEVPLDTLSSTHISYLRSSGIFEALHYALTHYAASGRYASGDVEEVKERRENKAGWATRRMHKPKIADIYEQMAQLIER